VLVKLKLKNSNDEVLVDDFAYNYLTTDPYLAEVRFTECLRKHSSGCVVFQRTYKVDPNVGEGFTTETIYLHKLLAEKYILEFKSKATNLVGAKNGNKLDCRVENLIFRSRSMASRQRKTQNKVGFMGVYRENARFRAVISINRKSLHLGMFDTPEEAHAAYMKKFREFFGEETKIINKAKKSN
jgi:hypothetical protein